MGMSRILELGGEAVKEKRHPCLDRYLHLGGLTHLSLPGPIRQLGKKTSSFGI